MRASNHKKLVKSMCVNDSNLVNQFTTRIQMHQGPIV